MVELKKSLFVLRLEILFALISLAVFVSDQLIKYLIHFYRPELNLKLFAIHFVQNTGAGFGIFKAQTGLLAIISLIVALAVLFFYRKIPREAAPQILFAVFLGGVLGNLIDRIFKGFVIDFIDLGFWPAFNVADTAITVSVIGLIIYFWKK
ncbi:MAG: signal peptidase II [Nanoarchaeota archaeon]